MFNLKDLVLIYDALPGTVVGKRYGHVNDPLAGRWYDVRLDDGTVKEVPEHRLQSIRPLDTVLGEPADAEVTYVAGQSGAAVPVRHPPRLVKRDMP